MKFLSIFSTLILFLFGLTACGSHEKSLMAEFNKNPELVQQTAIACLKKSHEGNNIDKDRDCMTVVVYEKSFCEMKQKEKALYYLNYDCKNRFQMMWLAASGF